MIGLYLERQGVGGKYVLSHDKNIVQIGRNLTNDIQFQSSFVSRKHCEIHRIPPHGTLLIKHLSNSNTTYVEETVLNKENSIAELRVGSLIGLGVPLELAYNKPYSDDCKFVYLKLCKEDENLSNETSPENLLNEDLHRANESNLNVAEKVADAVAVSPSNSDNGVAVSSSNSDNGVEVSPSNSGNPIAASIAASLSNSDNGVAVSPSNSDNGVAVSPSISDNGIAVSPSNSDDDVAVSPAKSDDSIEILGVVDGKEVQHVVKKELSLFADLSEVEALIENQNLNIPIKRENNEDLCLANSSGVKNVNETSSTKTDDISMNTNLTVNKTEITSQTSQSSQSDAMSTTGKEYELEFKDNLDNELEKQIHYQTLSSAEFCPLNSFNIKTEISGSPISKPFLCLKIKSETTGSNMNAIQKRNYNNSCIDITDSDSDSDLPDLQINVNETVKRKSEVNLPCPKRRKVTTELMEEGDTTKKAVPVETRLIETASMPCESTDSKKKKEEERAFNRVENSHKLEVVPGSQETFRRCEVRVSRLPKTHLKELKNYTEVKQVDTKIYKNRNNYRLLKNNSSSSNSSEDSLCKVTQERKKKPNLKRVKNRKSLFLFESESESDNTPLKSVRQATANKNRIISSESDLESVSSVENSLVRKNENLVKAKVSENLDSKRLLETNCKSTFDITHIKKEPVEMGSDTEFSGVKLKTEFDASVKKNRPYERTYNDDDDDDDGICYSQVDEIVLISSDEEESSYQQPSTSATHNVSFGPLPMNDNEDNDELPDLTKMEMEFVTSNDAPDGNEKVTTYPVEGEEGEDDDWFPVLSQNFFMSQDSETGTPNEEENRHIDSKIIYHSPQKDLNKIINKISNRETTRSKLTEPQAPIQRIRGRPKRKGKDPDVSSTSFFQQDSNLCSVTENRTQDKDECLEKTEVPNETISHKSDLKQSPKDKRSRRSSSSLRKTILKKHNLDVYKGKTKGKHHLVKSSHKSETKTSKEETKTNQNALDTNQNQPKTKNIEAKGKLSKTETQQNETKTSTNEIKSSLKETTSRNQSVNHNISILPKSSERASINKGFAKSSKTSRTAKLIEVNLFSPITQSKPKPKPKPFKIPKKKHSTNEDNLKLNEQHVSNNVGDVLNRNNCENTSEVLAKNGTEIDLNKNNKNINALNKVVNPSVLVSNTAIMKSILRSPASSLKKGARVWFPRNLVSFQIIPPREKKDCVGPAAVEYKEKYIKDSTDEPYEFIYQVCNWNFDWLATYQAAKTKQKNAPPPTVCSNTLLPTLTAYSSFQLYKDTFSCLMYNEVWEIVYKDWDHHMKTNAWFNCLVDVCKPQLIGTKKFSMVKACCLITEQFRQNATHPGVGSLVIMRHKLSAKIGHTFGYVGNIIKRRAQCTPQTLRNASPNGANTALILEILFSKGYVEAEMNSNAIVAISNISYIRPNFRAFESLCRLPSTSLYRFILDPGELNVYYQERRSSEYLIHELPLNEHQRNAVIEVSNKCFNEPDIPKVSLIHGPPGTGKTRVILALLAQINLLFKESTAKSNRRILLCAPSNVAVDDIIIRLSDLRKVGINLNVVRVGVKQSMTQEIKEFSFDTKVEHEFNKMQRIRNPAMDSELKKKETYYKNAMVDLENAKKKKNSSEMRKLRHIVDSLKRSKEEFEDSCKVQMSISERTRAYNECKKMVLLKAEIVATTLTSCLSGSLYEVWGDTKSSPFSCCIVDEAGQCKETETWFPLQLGIKKLVLVGDHLQLPATVISQLSHGKKLHQSLFQRIYHHVVIERRVSDAIHSLNVQYRMHEQILAWPALHFYNNEVVTAPGISEERTHPLKPFLIFDIVNSHEERRNEGEIFNMMEVSAIQALIEAHEKHVSRLSIGILTPYQQQKNLLLNKLSNLVEKHRITVSTIDNFQGKEKDIIYCSFVRSNSLARIGFVSDRQRMNVALTRARKSCFVVGSVASLQSSGDWKALIEDAGRRSLIRQLPSKLIQDRKALLRMSLA